MAPQSVDALRALAHQHILSSGHEAAGLLSLIFYRLAAPAVSFFCRLTLRLENHHCDRGYIHFGQCRPTADQVSVARSSLTSRTEIVRLPGVPINRVAEQQASAQRECDRNR